MDFYTSHVALNWRIGRDKDRPATPPGRDASWWSWDTGALYTVSGAMQWVQVNATTPPMTGATDSADGTAGTVPAPVIGDERRFLRGDATWSEAIDHPTSFGTMTVPVGRGQVLAGPVTITGSITVEGVLTIV